METRCFALGEDGRFVPTDFDAALEGAKVGGGTFWIDLEDPAPAGKAELFRRFGLDEETSERLLETGHAPRFLTLPEGGDDPTADFGYVRSGEEGEMGMIGNQVWYDVDGNGIYNPDGGDFGIAGVTVELLAINSSTTHVASTTTGASGDYVFSSLPPGTYVVRVTDEYGILSGLILAPLGPYQGEDNNNQAQPYQVIIVGDEHNPTADFAYTLPSFYGDYV